MLENYKQYEIYFFRLLLGLGKLNVFGLGAGVVRSVTVGEVGDKIFDQS